MRLYLLASTPYGYLHHRFQRLADGFRSLALHCTYLEQTYGWRAYLWGGRGGLAGEVRAAIHHHLHALRPGELRRHRGDDVSEGPAPEFEVLQLPLVIPTNRLNSAAVERLNARVFRSVLGETLRNRREEETIALVDNPLWGAALRAGDFTRIYYDCIDDVALYAGHASLDRFLEYERALVRSSTAVFVTAASLEDRLRSIDPGKPVFRLPNGVDYEWFQREASRRAKPEDIRMIPRPIVGYVGSIADWMDYDLVQAVAARHPGVSFVFVGPMDHSRRAAQLERSPNVYWLGKKLYDEVPLYVAAFDVCWIPFLGGRIVEHTNPIKMYEYFALGKPVVTTPMSEVEQYRAERLVYSGETTGAIIAAVGEALHDGDDDRRFRRLAVAREHAWSRIIRRMHDIMTGRHD
jgi:glycosyltransferase involved in cell wall biosynthesis